MNAYEIPENYKVGRMDGDRRRFYKNKQLAISYAADAAKHWDAVITTRTYFEPNHGFVAVLVTKENALPAAQAIGFEIEDSALAFVATKTPENWAKPTKNKPQRAVPGGTKKAASDGSQRPSRGKTLQAWELFDTMPDADRKERIAAGVELGLNPNMLGTQHSRWAKEQKKS